MGLLIQVLGFTTLISIIELIRKGDMHILANLFIVLLVVVTAETIRKQKNKNNT